MGKQSSVVCCYSYFYFSFMIALVVVIGSIRRGGDGGIIA